jgi:DoxX-like family
MPTPAISTTFPTAAGPASTAATWTGRGLSALSALFLIADSLAKILRAVPVMEGSAQLGYPAATVIPIGVTLLICVIAYVVPRTAVLGALLLTGYLGGAVATHVRVGDPLLTHTLFPVYFAVAIWAGLLLRDPSLRGILSRREA